jgi:hypothetical protein
MEMHHRAKKAPAMSARGSRIAHSRVSVGCPVIAGGRRAAAGLTGIVEQQQPRDVEPQEDHDGQQYCLDAQDGRPPAKASAPIRANRAIPAM